MRSTLVKMKRHATPLLTTALLLAPIASAAEGGLTRADGFAILWEGIRRPIEAASPAAFDDTLSHPRKDLLHYALDRNILEYDRYFYPDAPLTLEQAILWLLRTRNVDHPEDIVPATLPQFLRYYRLPLPTTLDDGRALTAAELINLIQQLDTFLAEEERVASFYSDEFEGESTAFGETFNPKELTAAHRFLPYNTLLKVTAIDSHKTVTVRVNDRGPYVKGRDLDLSRAAFESIAPLSRGTIRVRIKRLGDPSLVFSCGGGYQRRIGPDFILTPGLPHVRQVKTPLILRANYGFSITRITLPDGTVLSPHMWIGRLQPYKFNIEQAGAYTFTIHTGSERERTFTVRAVEECLDGAHRDLAFQP
jgi:hypothetical protein